jgi:hypothetical protein
MRALAGCLAFLFFLLICASHVAIYQDNSASSGHQSKHSQPEYIQEFFFSDAVRSQEKGEWQLTAGVDSRHFGISTLVKTEYGVTNRLQFGVELPYGVTEEETLDSRSHWRTVSLGGEYQIIRSDRPFAVSVGMAFGIPVRSNGEVEYEPTILLAKSFHRLQFHATFAADIEEEKPSFQYNLASVYPVKTHWFPTLEFNGRSLHGNGAFYVTPGVYRNLSHRVELGAGVPIGVGGRAGSMGIVGKVIWELGGNHEPE